ncbi:MAG: class I SAM-dependent methyltransferase [Pseudomonadota bacterium]
MSHHICPWWVGYLLANPLRRLLENPEKMLAPFVRNGMTVIDYGCGMGFFALPLARLVGPGGKVIAVDIQEKMLNALRKRAKRNGLSNLILLQSTGSENLIAEDSVDFVTALHVIHEIADQDAFFKAMYRVMKPEAKLLMLEPSFHVPEEEFRKSVERAEASGFVLTTNVDSSRSLIVTLSKP